MISSCGIGFAVIKPLLGKACRIALGFMTAWANCGLGDYTVKHPLQVHFQNSKNYGRFQSSIPNRKSSAVYTQAEF
jgi:hypothetical protein